MSIDPREKLIGTGRMEKYILRRAFDVSDDEGAEPYLPDSILWRQKEQFSDGVGYGWIDSLKDEANRHVTDKMMRSWPASWEGVVTKSKEA